MSVTHLTSVLRFDDCLKFGGTHKFEVTADEMPELKLRPHAQVQIACAQTHHALKGDTTWAHIIKKLADLEATCLYKRSGPATFEVTCLVPPPDGRRGRVKPNL